MVRARRIGALAPCRAVPTIAISAAVLLFVGFRSSPVVLQAARSVSLAAPRMTLLESAKVWTTAAWFARAKTPRDAVFLVPPPMSLGGFRLISERAVVVDSKVHPFGDAGLAEWYERMLFAYCAVLFQAVGRCIQKANGAHVGWTDLGSDACARWHPWCTLDLKVDGR